MNYCVECNTPLDECNESQPVCPRCGDVTSQRIPAMKMTFSCPVVRRRRMEPTVCGLSKWKEIMFNLLAVAAVVALICLFSEVLAYPRVQKIGKTEKPVDEQSFANTVTREGRQLHKKNRLVKIASTHHPRCLRIPLAVRFGRKGQGKVITPGRLLFWSDTGTNGGYWAFAKDGMKGPKGLHVLKDGDWLTIFNPNRSVRWEGRIKLKFQPPFQQSGGGLRIHNDQVGVERQFWAEMFFNELKAELTENADRKTRDD